MAQFVLRIRAQQNVGDPLAVLDMQILHFLEQCQRPPGALRVRAAAFDFGDDLALPLDMALTERDMRLRFRQMPQ